MIPQQTKDSRYWMLCRVITRMRLTDWWNTKFIAPGKIELTENPVNTSSLRLEAYVHVVDKETTYTKELETNKKRKDQKKILWSCGNSTFLHILDRIVFLRAELQTNLTKVLQLYEQIINLRVLTEILVQQSNFYWQ